MKYCGASLPCGDYAGIAESIRNVNIPGIADRFQGKANQKPKKQENAVIFQDVLTELRYIRTIRRSTPLD